MEKILTESQLTELRTLLDSSQRPVICGHVNPDGDAIGSTLALYNILRRQGKQPTVIVPTIFPDNLKWIPGANSILIYSVNPEAVREAAGKADLFLVTDLNEAKRMSDMQEVVLASQAPRVLIDHHLGPESFCQITISHPEMCAAGEVVCHVLDQLGWLDGITQDEAACLYTAMMCDTGGFAFSSNRPVIYEIISRLLTHGIDKDAIFRNIFWVASEARLRLQGFLLYVNMRVMRNLHAAIITLTNEERRHFNVKNGDTDGIVNIPLTMQGIRLSVFINEDTEHPGVMRLSLRSVGDVPCNEMANRFFSGGGHKNASGGRLECSMEEAVERVSQVISTYADILR